ncbi:hypothetical protein GH810_06610 [Acetobacterium paludosum]|uniref:Uncharacterized protein n=1 Tax=Acetobacterium paludosum TaxID=52693 RepID=A0A923HWM5_9FIRM|nr:hypothetical protein [Acetobacterium paludosum]MBC3887979.1 hypothetical protein [Acetobacterium paludosum]
MNYWQISDGNGETNLRDVFIDLNVALMGPGELGDYFDHKNEYENMGHGNKIGTFAEKVQIGDIFVLKHMKSKMKTWQILAVGEVVGEYQYEPIFGNVGAYGWDVQHCRRVNWKVPDEEIIVTGGAKPKIQILKDSNAMKGKAMELWDKLLFNYKK